VWWLVYGLKIGMQTIGFDMGGLPIADLTGDGNIF
jgi:hypothetical protein